MKRTLVLIACILALFCALTLTVSATEATEEGGTTVDVAGTEITLSEFFEEKILPALVSVGTTLIMGIPLLLPYITKSQKFKQLQGLYTKTVAENKNVQELLKCVDLENMQVILKKAVDEKLDGVLADIKDDNAAAKESVAMVKLLSAQVDALVKGATNAWAQSPAAVACLTASPTENTVKQLSAENQALQSYIRGQKGAEAEAVIAEIKGGVANDELGKVSAV